LRCSPRAARFSIHRELRRPFCQTVCGALDAEEMRSKIERALTRKYDEVIHKALAYKKTLIQRQDTARHLIMEAVGDV
jgi:hypothetical protein